MGVRESLAGQPEGETRLHDLSIEAKEPLEDFFDPETEFDETDWEKAKKYAESETVHAVRSAFWFKLVSPERFKELNLNDKIYNAGKKEALQHCALKYTDQHIQWGVMGPMEWQVVTDIARAVKMVFPDKIGDFLHDIDLLGYWEEMKKSVEGWGLDREGAISTLVAAARILSPEKFKEFDIKESNWLNLKDALEGLCNQGEWRAFARLAAQMRIIFPERFDKAKIVMPVLTKVIESFGDLKRRYREEAIPPPSTFPLNFAADLMIISAEDVRVTDQGLQLTMPSRKNFREQIPNLPERKNF